MCLQACRTTSNTTADCPLIRTYQISQTGATMDGSLIAVTILLKLTIKAIQQNLKLFNRINKKIKQQTLYAKQNMLQQ